MGQIRLPITPTFGLRLPIGAEIHGRPFLYQLGMADSASRVGDLASFSQSGGAKFSIKLAQVFLFVFCHTDTLGRRQTPLVADQLRSKNTKAFIINSHGASGIIPFEIGSSNSAACG